MVYVTYRVPWCRLAKSFCRQNLRIPSWCAGAGATRSEGGASTSCPHHGTPGGHPGSSGRSCTRTCVGKKEHGILLAPNLMSSILFKTHFLAGIEAVQKDIAVDGLVQGGPFWHISLTQIVTPFANHGNYKNDQSHLNPF